MPDPADAYGQRRRSFLPILLALIAALLIGMGGMAWLFRHYDQVARIIKPATPVVIPTPVQPLRPALVNIAPPPASEVVQAVIDQRIGKIEEKVDDIDERTAAANSEAHRAERLLIAFAARRAIDRGAPLGYLEGVLRERFNFIEPAAVATVISAGRQPVTITQLREKLDALKPELAVNFAQDGWWQAFRRELATMIVVRNADMPANAPVDRFGRAQEDLAAGHVDAALVEIARLPNRKAASGWIADARRYVQARAALDRIESAALLDPVDAKAASPMAVRAN